MSRVFPYIAAFFVLHGLVHLLGVTAYWRLGRVDGLAYKTTVGGGRWDLGDRGIRVYGGAFLLAALGFVIAGIGVASQATWWPPLVIGAALVSLAVTALDWETAHTGAILDVAILGAIGLALAMS